jgi:hypothetical protein
MDSAYAGFDALISAPPEPKPDAKPAADTKPAPDTKLAPETKPDEIKSPAEVKGTQAKPGELPPKVKASTLRDELDRTRTEAADWKSKYETLQSESSKPKADTEKEQLLKDRESWNKRRDELENELKFSNYERSTEYKEKYQQPFLKAYEQGQKLLATLNFKDPDKSDEFGAVLEPGKTRKGSEADWDALMAIQDEDTANKFIADHFGYNAARITMQRDKVLDHHTQMRTAIEDFRKQAGTRETQFRELQTKSQKEASERWHAANKLAAEKYPQLFGTDPADAKGNDLLAYGTRLTDLAFGILDPSEIVKLPTSLKDKLVNGQLPQAEMTLLHSAIRNRAAAHDRLVYRLNQKDTELKELREQLAGYEQSAPGRGETRRVEAGGKKKGATTLDDIDAEFDRLAAGNG